MSQSEKLRALVASHFIEEVRREFADAFDATFEATREVVTAIEARASGAELLILSLDVPVDAATIRQLPSTLRAIATYSVGTDHIDLAAAAERGIAVFNTPGVLGDSTAENAMLLMLGAARRATEAIELIRSREWKGWTPTQLVGVQLAGRRLGILGMGDIGLRIARRARAFGMEIAYCNRQPSPHASEVAATFVRDPRGPGRSLRRAAPGGARHARDPRDRRSLAPR